MADQPQRPPWAGWAPYFGSLGRVLALAALVITLILLVSGRLELLWTGIVLLLIEGALLLP